MSGSLVGSEHRYRAATREQGILNLGMQRIDVRCSALESISTQATLVAGFAFGSLQPDVLDSLANEETIPNLWLRHLFSVAFIASSAVSFSASIWVIYMSLYVGYKAQFSALQGKSGFAVSTSLQILLRSNERIAEWFNISLIALAVGAVLMCFAHLALPAFLALVGVFGYFVRDCYTFQTSLDHSFHVIGDPDASGMADAAIALDGRGSGKEPEPSQSAKEDVKGDEDDRSAERARMKAYNELRGHEEQGRTLKGWLHKSPSRLGPANSPPASQLSGGGSSSADAKRFFVLRGCELRWYVSEDEAMLERSARTVLDMRLYECRCVGGAALTFAIVPASAGAKKSWYLRARDQHSFDEWVDALSRAASAGVRAHQSAVSFSSSTRGAPLL